MTAPRTLALSALAVLLLSVPTATSSTSVSLPHEAIQAVLADLFDDVDVAALDLAVTCSGGVMSKQVNEASFHFQETDDPAPTQVIYPTGYGVTGCGRATLNTSIPAGTEHIHVRFNADRVLQEFNLAGFPFRASIRFNQSVLVYVDDQPTPLAQQAYFDERESGHDRQAITIPTVHLPANAKTLRIDWTFEDRGTLFGNATQDAPQGVAYSSTIDNATIEFSSVPLRVLSVEDSSSRSGQALIHEYRTRFEAPADLLANYSADLRLRLDEEQQFTSAHAPDGTVLTTIGTRFTDGPNGFDRRKVLQENPGNDPVSQITISGELAAEHGPGIYEVRTAYTQLLDPTTGLIPLAAILLALPFPFGVAAFVRVRAFEREAFGAFRRAGAKLRWSLVIVALYYLAVVLSAIPGNRLAALVTLPLSASGWILYGQVLVAILAFVSLWLVANELFGITRPKEPVQE